MRLGLWSPPEPPLGFAESARVDGEIPLVGDYAWDWLEAKINGVFGSKPISENTASDYRWRLRCHLLPFFGHLRLDQIDRELCLTFKAHLLREARELREALEAGADIRDRRGRKAVPLGPASIRKVIDALAGILDDAIEDGHVESNPARGKRMRVRVPKPKRTFLEMDELACLLDVAGEQEVPLPAGASASRPRAHRGASRPSDLERHCALLRSPTGSRSPSRRSATTCGSWERRSAAATSAAASSARSSGAAACAPASSAI